MFWSHYRFFRFLFNENSFNMPVTEKRCPGCSRVLPARSFYLNQSRPDGLQNYCNDCKRERQIDWYKRHRKAQVTRTNSRRAERRGYARRKIYELLKSSACVDCDEKHPACLEFDHVRGEKKMAVSSLVKHGYSWKSIQAEIEKCEIRCANCHRKRTTQDQGWYADLM